MKVTITTTITPAMPVKRTVEAVSTLEAVREVINHPDTSGFFERTTKNGGGLIVISAFPERERAITDARQRVSTKEGGLELQ